MTFCEKRLIVRNRFPASSEVSEKKDVLQQLVFFCEKWAVWGLGV